MRNKIILFTLRDQWLAFGFHIGRRAFWLGNYWCFKQISAAESSQRWIACSVKGSWFLQNASLSLKEFINGNLSWVWYIWHIWFVWNNFNSKFHFIWVMTVYNGMDNVFQFWNKEVMLIETGGTASLCSYCWFSPTISVTSTVLFRTIT